MEHRTYGAMKDLIETVTENQNRISITTDGFSTYSIIADELGFKHQRSVFHLFKDVQEKVMDELKKNEYDTLIIR
ncbi:MAG: hypothetical protein LBM96_08210 [Methanobrevibacter sp.]|jgi:hypothetical protein|nr:hypothetical protein [Candidatus Methanoflexus mossambicus]